MSVIVFFQVTLSDPCMQKSGSLNSKSCEATRRISSCKKSLQTCLKKEQKNVAKWGLLTLASDFLKTANAEFVFAPPSVVYRPVMKPQMICWTVGPPATKIANSLAHFKGVRIGRKFPKKSNKVNSNTKSKNCANNFGQIRLFIVRSPEQKNNFQMTL